MQQEFQEASVIMSMFFSWFHIQEINIIDINFSKKNVNVLQKNNLARGFELSD